MKEKALKLAELMHIPDFIAGDGWLDNFTKRHGIMFKTAQSEAGAVDLQSLLEWIPQVLQSLVRQFSVTSVPTGGIEMRFGCSINGSKVRKFGNLPTWQPRFQARPCPPRYLQSELEKLLVFASITITT